MSAGISITILTAMFLIALAAAIALAMSPEIPDFDGEDGE